MPRGFGAIGAFGLAVGLASAVECATAEPGYRTAQADRVAAPAQGMAPRDQLAGVPNFYSARSTAAPGSGAFAGVEDTAEPAPVPPPTAEAPAAGPVNCNHKDAPDVTRP